MTKDRKPSKKFYEPRDNERVPDSKVVTRDDKKMGRPGSSKPPYREEPFKRRNDDNRSERGGGFKKEGSDSNFRSSEDKYKKSEGKPFEKSFSKDRGDRPERRDKPSFGDKDKKRDGKPFEKSFSRDRGDRPERRDKPSFGDKDKKRDGKPFEKSFSKDRGERPERRDKPSFGDKDKKRDGKPFEKSFSRDRGDRPERRDKPSFGDKDKKRDGKPFEKSFSRDRGDRPERRDKPSFGDKDKRRDGKPFEKSFGKDRYDRSERKGQPNRENSPFGNRENPFKDRQSKSLEDSYEKVPERDSRGRFVKKDRSNSETVTPMFDRKSEKEGDKDARSGAKSKDRFYEEIGFRAKKKKTSKAKKKEKEKTGDPRLNRFIANAGVCSRRDADELIKAGKIEVNGVVVTEMGIKIGPKDVVKYAGKRLYNHKPVYIVMNKPKDCICTAEDPEGRRTVLDILEGEVEERVFPVGRLDRNTTGVLIITNDGELTQKLTHPSSELTKVYAATLDKDLEQEHLEQLKSGIELEDGPMAADDIAYTDAGDKKHIGIEIHSGRNRIIHRMFEHLGYRVDRLDRVLFAGMDKRGLKRGEWRYLKEKEITTLKRIKGN